MSETNTPKLLPRINETPEVARDRVYGQPEDSSEDPNGAGEASLYARISSLLERHIDRKAAALGVVGLSFIALANPQVLKPEAQVVSAGGHDIAAIFSRLIPDEPRVPASPEEQAKAIHDNGGQIPTNQR